MDYIVDSTVCEYVARAIVASFDQCGQLYRNDTYFTMIKAIHTVLGLGLKESQELIESALARHTNLEQIYEWVSDSTGLLQGPNSEGEITCGYLRVGNVSDGLDTLKNNLRQRLGL